MDDDADRTILRRFAVQMTIDTHEPRERLTRPAMIEEFQQARRRNQIARDQILVRTVNGLGKRLPVADAPPTAEDVVDRLDLIRWDTDKG